jgi:hypothetical protein
MAKHAILSNAEMRTRQLRLEQCNETVGAHRLVKNPVLLSSTLYLTEQSDCACGQNATVELGSRFVMPHMVTDKLNTMCSWCDDANPRPGKLRRIENLSIMVGCPYPWQVGHIVYNGIAGLFDVLHDLGRIPTNATVFFAQIRPEVADFIRQLVRHTLGAQAEVQDLADMLRQSKETAFVFDELVVGIYSSELDHYNFDPCIFPKWRRFIDTIKLSLSIQNDRHAILSQRLKNRPVLGCRLPAVVDVLVVNRRGTRKIINADQVVLALRRSCLTHSVNIVYYEDLSFDEQVSLSSSVDVIVGMDGTGLLNAHFMQGAGLSAILRVLPYGGDVLTPKKSNNFEHIWDALGIHHECLVVKEKKCTISRNITKLSRAIEAPSGLSLQERYDMLFTQDTLLDAGAVIASLDRLFRKIRTGLEFSYLPT